MVRARRRGESTIEAVFTEALAAGAGANGAERAENYRLSGGARIVSARLEGDLRTVTLETTPLGGGETHTLTVSSVADRADRPNQIAEGTTITVR